MSSYEEPSAAIYSQVHSAAGVGMSEVCHFEAIDKSRGSNMELSKCCEAELSQRRFEELLLVESEVPEADRPRLN